MHLEWNASSLRVKSGQSVLTLLIKNHKVNTEEEGNRKTGKEESNVWSPVWLGEWLTESRMGAMPGNRGKTVKQSEMQLEREPENKHSAEK